MTDYWNRCHECERLLTEPEDEPGLCAPCKMILEAKHGKLSGRDHRRTYPTLTGYESPRFHKEIDHD